MHTGNMHVLPFLSCMEIELTNNIFTVPFLLVMPSYYVTSVVILLWSKCWIFYTSKYYLQNAI